VTTLPHCYYTGIIQDKDILRAASQEVTDLTVALLVNTHNLAGMCMLEKGTTLENYIDDMK
jgi:hypothetical protein